MASGIWGQGIDHLAYVAGKRIVFEILTYSRTSLDPLWSAPNLQISSEDGGCEAVGLQCPMSGSG